MSYIKQKWIEQHEQEPPDDERHPYFRNTGTIQAALDMTEVETGWWSRVEGRLLNAWTTNNRPGVMVVEIEVGGASDDIER